MKTRIAVDRFGRVVIPKDIRQSLHLPRAAVFEAEVLGNRLELRPAEAPIKLRKNGRLLVVPKQGEVVDAVEAMEQTRADRRHTKL